MTVEGIAALNNAYKERHGEDTFTKQVDFLLAEIAKRDKALDVIEVICGHWRNRGSVPVELIDKAFKLAGRIGRDGK